MRCASAQPAAPKHGSSGPTESAARDEDLIKFTDWFYDTDSAIRTQSEIERLYRDATALGFKVERKKLT